MKRQILFCINLILVMLITGVFWGTWFTLTRSLDVFPADNLAVNTVPDNWTALRTRWNTFHTLRTFTSILSFVFLSIGIIIDNEKIICLMNEHLTPVERS